MEEKKEISDIFLYPGPFDEINSGGLYQIMLVDGEKGEISIAYSGSRHFREELAKAEYKLKAEIHKMGGHGGIHKKTQFSMYSDTVHYLCSAVPVQKTYRDRLS